MSGLVSAVVPVYNVEAYLPTCVESILAQTYRNLEVVLVDDGSPDGCGSLCDAYAARDGRVRAIHRPNGGLSAARNTGLDAVQGDYVAFVDSDDEVSPVFVETLVGALEAGDADIAQCGFSTRRAGLLPDMAVRHGDGAGGFERLTGRQASERLQFDSSGAYTVVWNKLYRSTLFERLRFPEGKQHEDEFVTYRALWAAGGVCVTEACLYYYRQRGDSTMGVGFNPRSLDAVEALTQRAAFYREQGDERLALLTDATTCHRLYGMMRDIERELPADGASAWKCRASELFRRVLRAPEIGMKKKLGLCWRRARGGAH